MSVIKFQVNRNGGNIMSKADLLIELFKEAADCTKCEKFSGKKKEQTPN